jgi:hypothetical protein
MNPRAIFRLPTPEEAALTRAQLTLAALRATLAQRESALTQLRSRLHSFEGRYIRQVGVLYVQLDDWYRRIAELDSPLELPESFLPEIEPSTNAGAPGSAATPSAPGSATTLGAPGLASETWVAGDDISTSSAPSLKTLYRHLARRIHPDLATTPADEARRTRLMALANDALLRADAALLHRMVHAHDHDPAALTPAETLTQTLAAIQQTEQDLTRIAAELHDLHNSEMASLERRTLAAAAEGHDLLAELAARVKGSIGIAIGQYERDLARFKRKQSTPPPTTRIHLPHLRRPR